MSILRKSSEPPSIFPTYLLPSLSFRRSSFNKSRHNSSDSTNSTATRESVSSRGTWIDSPSSNPFSRSATPLPAPVNDEPIEAPTDKYLHGLSSNIQCSRCATDICLTSQIISKGFTGRDGRAYLVSGHPSTKYASTTRTSGVNGALPNTFLDKPIARSLITGQHMVADLYCNVCATLLGWKYVEASEESQKYKVGKFILEARRTRVASRWDNPEGSGFATSHLDEEESEPVGSVGEAELDLDSQDEDECEDLFAGVWSPGLARRRRQRKSERFKRKATKVYLPRGSQDSLG